MIPPLTEDELRRVDAWVKAGHLKCAHTYRGAIGGHFEYWAIPTSLGTCYGVRCLTCKNDELNLTDFDNW